VIVLPSLFSVNTVIKNKKERDQFIKAVKEIRDLREADKKKAYEEKMDEWFSSLSVLQQADVAYNFWDGATYEQKKEEYEIE